MDSQGATASTAISGLDLDCYEKWFYQTQAPLMGARGIGPDAGQVVHASSDRGP